METDEIFFFCDRCGERCYREDSIEEDGLIYHKDCYEKMIEKE